MSVTTEFTVTCPSHARVCPWDEARRFLGSAAPAVSDEPEWE